MARQHEFNKVIPNFADIMPEKVAKLPRRSPEESRIMDEYVSGIRKAEDVFDCGNIAHVATERRYEDLIGFLQEFYGPQCIEIFTHKNAQGKTPLHLAAEKGMGYMTELLLEYSNPEAVDACGQTPLHLAVIALRDRDTEEQYMLIKELLLDISNASGTRDAKGRLPQDYAPQNYRVNNMFFEASQAETAYKYRINGKVFARTNLAEDIAQPRFDDLIAAHEKNIFERFLIEQERSWVSRISATETAVGTSISF
jgi:hypothetical protein